VKFGWDPENNCKVAIKILKSDLSDKTRELVKEEVATMQKLSHPNILEQIETGQAMYKNSKGEREVDFVVLSIAGNGEVFDFIANSGPFKESVARYYFK